MKKNLLTDNGYTPKEEQQLVRESEYTKAMYRSGRRKARSSVQAMQREIMAGNYGFF